MGTRGPGDGWAVISEETPRQNGVCVPSPQRQPGSGLGFLSQGEGQGRLVCDVPAGWGRTQHFGSRLGAFKPLLVAGSVCVLISGCVGSSLPCRLPL